jgi:hypothetical protein
LKRITAGLKAELESRSRQRFGRLPAIWPATRLDRSTSRRCWRRNKRMSRLSKGKEKVREG